MSGMSNDGIVTVDSGGCVRLWETALASLDQSIEKWRGLIGKSEGKPLSVKVYLPEKNIILSMTKVTNEIGNEQGITLL